MLPLFVRGSVVHGFGRGSKQLGIPTANMADNVVANLPGDVKSGVYFGFASVRSQNGTKCADALVHPAVASIGWNPFYKNTKRTLEVHLLQVFPEDFYGAELRVCLVGYIREQTSFASTDELIRAIGNDISVCKEKVKEASCEEIRNHEFFSTRSAATEVRPTQF